MLSLASRRYVALAAPRLRLVTRTMATGDVNDEKFAGAAADKSVQGVNYLDGGKYASTSALGEFENKTVTSNGFFMRPFNNAPQGNAFGMYFGTLKPDGRIGREIHPCNTETIYIIEGSGSGFIGKKEFPMNAGDVMHVEKDTFHGLHNAGSTDMKIIVVGNPDY